MNTQATTDLDQLGKFVAAEIKTARKYEAAAKEKAGVDLQKADNHWTAAAQYLAEARTRCSESGESFKDFKKKYAPDLSRATLYRVIAIGSGKFSIEEQRKEWREKQQEKRAAAKASQTSSLSETDQPAPPPEPTSAQSVKTDGFTAAAEEQVTGVISGLPSSWDTAEASGEKRKAENAVKFAEPEAKINAEPKSEPASNDPWALYNKLRPLLLNIDTILQKESDWPELSSANKQKRRTKALNQFGALRRELLSLAEPSKKKAAAPATESAAEPAEAAA